MSFPGREHFTHVSQFTAEGIKSILCDSKGRGCSEASAWFPPDFAPGAFLFADLVLHPLAVM